MIGSLNTLSYDTTPRKDGKLGGSRWTAIGTGSDPVPLFSVPAPVTAERTLRISYEVRGRFGTAAPILVVGQANVTLDPLNDPVITEDVRTFTNARVSLSVDVFGPSIRIEAEQHATETWEFQAKVAYDLVVAST